MFRRRVFQAGIPTLLRFARLILLKVQLRKVSKRISTSIVLLTVLFAGITPTGVCALLCERHARGESQRHCSQPPDRMAVMTHDRSGMNHAGVHTMNALSVSQSCRTNCGTTALLNVWRKAVPQVTVVRSSAVVLGTRAAFLVPDLTAIWGFDSDPPARPSARTASFSILRI
jgi:hypothetical protein